MWTNLKLIKFLTILVYVKCESNSTIKENNITSSKEAIPSTTHKINLRFIDWQNITEVEETANNTNYSPRLVTSAVSNETLQNASTTWTPEETTLMTHMSDTTIRMSKGIDMCKNYKPPENPFHVQDMADIWQILYYQMEGNLQCFRIYIRKVSEGERISYKIRYGTFDDKVNWTKVMLEIRNRKHFNRRRHFLQGSDEDDGVMINVIITYDEEHYRYELHEESPDQWLVYRNLLLMRDCDTGGVVIFSKVPHLPMQRDIGDALSGFNEVFKDGKYTCYDEINVIKFYEEDDKE